MPWSVAGADTERSALGCGAAIQGRPPITRVVYRAESRAVVEVRLIPWVPTVGGRGFVVVVDIATLLGVERNGPIGSGERHASDEPDA